MNTDPRTACGLAPRPISAQTNRCLPFCGLGAQEYVQRKAALCGVLQPEQRSTRSGELSDTITES